jgi:hypothetical protein
MIPRQLLREAAATALQAKTRAATRIYCGRPNPFSHRPHADGGGENLPAIVVYTRSTRSQVFDESPRRYRHEVELAVECSLAIEEGQDIDDSLDAFEQEVLNVLLLDDTLGGTVDDLQLTRSTNTIDGEGEQLLGAVILTFEATLLTNAPVDGTQVLDDLRTVRTEYSLDGNQDDPRDRAITNIEGLDL